jgi:hypothetical protein
MPLIEAKIGASALADITTSPESGVLFFRLNNLHRDSHAAIAPSYSASVAPVSCTKDPLRARIGCGFPVAGRFEILADGQWLYAGSR